MLREEQTAAYTVEIWKRFRKWGGIPTGITQNVKDLLSSREVENIFENSDYVFMLNQASGDRQILAKQLNISPHQLSYVTHSGEGEGLLFYGSTILPFVDRFPKDTELYDTNEKGNSIRKQLEIDFVCNKGSKRYYIQSAYAIPDQAKMEQEQRSLMLTGDFFKRIIITKDTPAPHYNENGVLIMSVYDFLLDENSLDI